MTRPPEKQTTDQLIAGLAERVTPVTPRRFGAGATVLWVIAVFAIITLVGIPSVRWHHEDGLALWSWKLGFGLVGALVTVLGAGHAGVNLLAPGRRIPSWSYVAIALGVTSMAASLVLTGGATIAGMTDLHGMKCCVVLGIFAILPAVALTTFARRQAPTRLAALGGMIGACTAAAGYGVMLVVCESNDAAHLAVFHLLPAVVLALGGAALLKTALRW